MGHGYQYDEERDALFTERGQEVFIAVRDTARRLLSEAGAFRADRAWHDAPASNTWTLMACLDMLVEREEIVEWRRPDGGTPPGQHRVFVVGPKWPDR